MKKGLLAAAVIIIILFALFVSLKPQPSKTFAVNVSCSESAAGRYLMMNDRSKWWPGKKLNDTFYSFKNIRMRITGLIVNGFNVTLYTETDSLPGSFEAVRIDDYTSVLQFTLFTDKTTRRQRFIDLLRKNKFESAAADFTHEAKQFFDKEENVYGMKVIADKVKDSSLLSGKQDFDHIPTTDEVYKLIYALQDYARSKGGEQTAAPMLNVHTDDSVHFTAMAAIPLKKDIPITKEFIIKKMVLGNILRAQVQGGPARIKKAEEQMYFYMNDHSKTAPAIPFQSLVTDRFKEKDTSKWVTVLYYPIFY